MPGENAIYTSRWYISDVLHLAPEPTNAAGNSQSDNNVKSNQGLFMRTGSLFFFEVVVCFFGTVTICKHNMRQSSPKECKFFKDTLQSMFIKCCRAVIVQSSAATTTFRTLLKIEKHDRLQPLVKASKYGYFSRTKNIWLHLLCQDLLS